MKKYFLFLVVLFLLIPISTFAKSKTLKIYLDVQGSNAYTDTFASGLRADLKKFSDGDIKFVKDSTDAIFVITVEIMPLSAGSRSTGFVVAWAVSAPKLKPSLQMLSGPDDLEDITKRTAANINESLLEPLRERLNN
jgi:hypothetical protein